MSKRVFIGGKGSVSVCGYNMSSSEKEAKEELIVVVLDDGGLYGNLTIYQMKKILSVAYSSWDEARYIDGGYDDYSY